MDSLGQNTGVGRLSLFQGIFLTVGLNSGLPHCRWILDQLNYKGINEAELDRKFFCCDTAITETSVNPMWGSDMGTIFKVIQNLDKGQTSEP